MFRGSNIQFNFLAEIANVERTKLDIKKVVLLKMWFLVFDSF